MIIDRPSRACAAINSIDVVRRVGGSGGERHSETAGSRADGAPSDSSIFNCGTAYGLSGGSWDECSLCLCNACVARLSSIAGNDGSLVLLVTSAGREVKAVCQIADLLSRIGGRRVSLAGRQNCLT